MIAPDGPLLVVAGAGSGKTRVLTSRIAYLVMERKVSPFQILAITFTNKAAGEMKERVAALVGPVARRMWVATFHSACSRILRREAEHLGLRSAFTIYDQADAVRLTDYVRRDLNIDPKRFPPRQLHGRISALKNELVLPEQYAATAMTPPEKMLAKVYSEYQRRLLDASAVDFDDLLVLTVRLFREHPDVLARWQQRFSHVLVDEFQDTNLAQWELVQMLAHEHRNLLVVGDTDQCLFPGTLVTMGDGSRKVIEDVAVGDEVLSNYGSGDFRPAPVVRTHQARTYEGVTITLASGRRITSTPDHVHFAGFVVGRTPQQHMVYVMWKAGVGFRIGTSRTYTDGQPKSFLGPVQRCHQERADAMWVISAHDDRSGRPVGRGVPQRSLRDSDRPLHRPESRARRHHEPGGEPDAARQAVPGAGYGEERPTAPRAPGLVVRVSPSRSGHEHGSSIGAHPPSAVGRAVRRPSGSEHDASDRAVRLRRGWSAGPGARWAERASRPQGFRRLAVRDGERRHGA